MSLAETVVFGAIMGGPATAGALCRTLLEMAAPSAFYTHKCIVEHIKMGLAVQDRSRDLYAGEILVENQAVPRHTSHAPTLHSYGRGNAASSRSITTGALHSLKFGSSTSKLTILINSARTQNFLHVKNLWRQHDVKSFDVNIF